jgi:DNA-binding MarR family transcriptional regulator
MSSNLSDWKAEVLRQANLVPWSPIGLRELTLLFLAADGRSPVTGEEVIHLSFFFYPYAEARLSPSLLFPRLEELDKVLDSLEAEGLIERSVEPFRGRLTTVIRLTERGVAEARKLTAQLSSSWVVLAGLAVRRGSEVISELEALKKTYNGRSPLELLKLLVSKLEAEGENVIWHLRGVDEKKVVQSLISVSKQLSRELKSALREVLW